MSRTFQEIYNQMWTDEIHDVKHGVIRLQDSDKILDKLEYGRRKFAVIRTMTKQEIWNSFKDDPDFGSKLSGKGKEAMIRVLRNHSGFF